MANILHDRIKNFQFENSVEWLVQIPDFNLDPIMCESVTFPTADIQLVQDNLGLEGSYKTVKKEPELSFIAFSDSAREFEKYLTTWMRSLYNETTGGLLPPSLSQRLVNIFRFNSAATKNFPTILKDVVLGGDGLLNKVSSFYSDATDEIAYRCWIERPPLYEGTPEVGIRRISVKLKVLRIGLDTLSE